MEDWNNIPGMASWGGYIYVLEFSNGVIKVGSTKNPRQRLQVHVKDFQLSGATLDRYWLSEPFPEYLVAESKLIEYGTAESESVIRKEYFTGLVFGEVVAAAEELCDELADSNAGTVKPDEETDVARVPVNQAAWRHIATDIKGKVKAGKLEPHIKLPSLPELAEQYDCSIGTVRRALEVLQGTGEIYSRQGKGYYIAERAGNESQRFMGAAEIQERLGVSRQRAYILISRKNFPEPIATLKMGSVWLASDIEDWMIETGRI
ncbi:GntR family transcriptional regulator [Micromonospora aurantiaca (nom. illeg.)]|uniref:GntR family transcriptional regulator n=1 Tax=Micromonospora aurantiaca (nom. illeg.) TaxID=47850 RepID=UPI0037B37DB7